MPHWIFRKRVMRNKFFSWSCLGNFQNLTVAPQFKSIEFLLNFLTHNDHVSDPWVAIWKIRDLRNMAIHLPPQK